MLGYYLRLAFKSFQRNPGLTAIMVSAIALGIATCVVTVTVYHAMSGDPIWWKSDRLYAVTMDSWDPAKPFNAHHPELPPPQLSYRDAQALYASEIPKRKAIMSTLGGVISGGTLRSTAQPAEARVTSADFFAMFDVPFLFGNGWSASADAGPEPVMVLSRAMNDRLFGGADSVGRTVLWNDRPFRIIGVLDRWLPLPKFYDLTTGAFNKPEDVFIPFGWAADLATYPSGDEECWNANIRSFHELLNSDCLWLQMWVELPDHASRERMQSFIDAYWADQHRAGRFLRARNNRLTPVDRWLAENDVVPDDNRILVALAFAFLAVCLINTAGLLLAKFLGRSALAGIRRALGASRREILVQHLAEVALLALIGAGLGLLLAAFGLWGVHALYAEPDRGGYQELAHFDLASIYAAFTLAIVSAAAAGLYPAWRIGRVAPATYLKGQ
ncbi:MAG TPA: ABC transporter permease [Steroidobacteraceae bacterium]|nr:ABC transporter permease [Steroidobacteraceae bacterium]